MIKISRLQGYLLGVLLAFIIYFIAQLLFFNNTREANGFICDIRERRHKNEYFYVCFSTPEEQDIKIRAGSNMDYYIGDSVRVVYKSGNPKRARLKNFHSLWVRPSMIYLLPLGIILAMTRGLFFGSRYLVITGKPLRVKFSKT